MNLKTYILSLLIILLISSFAFAEGERVDARCEVGISNKIKEHRWHGLYVTLTNKYPTRKDVLVTVTRKVYDQPTLVLKQSVAMDSGERPIPIKLEFLCPPVKLATGITYVIQVTDKYSGRTLMKYYNKHFKKVKRNDKEYWVGKWFEKDNIENPVTILSQNEEQIITVNANNSMKLIRMIIEDADFQSKNYIIANRQMDDLPTNWLELHGIKLIILNNPEISKLQYSGRDKALEDWIRAGGTLILMLSEKSEEYKNLPLTKLAGVQLKTVTVANKLKQKAKKLSVKPSTINLNGSFQCIDADIIDPDNTVTEFWAYRTKPNPDRKNLMPIVNVRYLDSGKIYSVLLDIRSSTNVAIPEYLFDNVIKPVFFDLKPRTLYDTSKVKPEQNNGNNSNITILTESSSTETEIQLQHLFGNSINNIQQAKPIKFGIIAAFIGIYMIVVAFVDFLLLRFISLLHWTWLSVLLWVIAFSAIADKIGETFRGGDMSVRELVVVDSGMNYENSTYHQFAGIFSQQNQSYTVYHESDKCGITRLERLVGNLNDDEISVRLSNTKSNLSKNQSVDAQTEFTIAQPSDADELKHEGAYIKSVILPRWVIRDLQSDSIVENKNKKGLNVEFSKELGYYDIKNDIYSDEKFTYTDNLVILDNVSKVAVRNDYPYPINGICFIYSKNKIATYSGHLNPNETINFYYETKQDVLLSGKLDKSDEYISRYNFISKSSSTISFDDMLRDFRDNNRGSFSSLIKKENQVYKIYADSLNEIRMPKDALLVLLSSCRKILQRNSDKNKSSKSTSEYMIQSQAYNKLDISHRIDAGDTVILSWTNWHLHENISPETENTVSNFSKPVPGDYSEYSDYDPGTTHNEIQPMPTYKYNFPEIQFEDWKCQSSRFIVNRLITKPLADFYMIRDK